MLEADKLFPRVATGPPRVAPDRPHTARRSAAPY